MGPKFFQTIMGKRFIEGTIPAVLGQIKQLNNNLERINTNLEMLLSKEHDKVEKEDK